jgi:hypothetical protein
LRELEQEQERRKKWRQLVHKGGGCGLLLRSTLGYCTGYQLNPTTERDFDVVHSHPDLAAHVFLLEGRAIYAKDGNTASCQTGMLGHSLVD